MYGTAELPTALGKPILIPRSAVVMAVRSHRHTLDGQELHSFVLSLWRNTRESRRILSGISLEKNSSTAPPTAILPASAIEVQP